MMTRIPEKEISLFDTIFENKSKFEKLKAWIHRNSLWVLLIAVISTLALGLWGFHDQFLINEQDGTILDAFYRSIQLFWLRSGSDFYNPILQINIARFAAAFIFTFSTIYFFSRFFKEEIRLSLIRARIFFFSLFFKIFHNIFPFIPRYTGHVVVCGAGFLGSVIACHFRKEGKDVIVLEKNRDNPEVKICEEHGAVILYRDASKPDVLSHISIHGAAMVFAVTGNDSLNSDIASFCAAIAKERPKHLGPLKCHVHIDDTNLSFALRQWELEIPNTEKVHFSFFNLYHSAGNSAAACESRKVIKDSKGLPGQPVVLIVGLGDFGKSLLVNLVKKWREKRGNSSVKMKIIVIDQEANTRVDNLCAFFPSLLEYCVIIPQNLEVHSKKFLDGFFLDEIELGQITGVYICLKDEGDATSVAITFHDILCERFGCCTTGSTTPQIIVRTINDYGMTEVIRKLRESLKWNIHAFPILTNFCEEKRYGSDLSEMLAEATHKDYLEREYGKGKTEKDNSSAVPWSKLPEDLRDQNRDQAESLIRNIHDYGYHVVPMRKWDEEYLKFDKNDPMIEKLAIKEHERYVKMKKAQGYRYGNNKNAMENSTLIPWDDSKLSKEERDKDIDTILELPNRLARVFFKLERKNEPNLDLHMKK